mmetsp:Transcript_3408/g.8441  ORF Transcript_3408/g.8441 Transcript_3408/m.8441 type:complete len:251 (-) Transcript_3408:846-1598(-)
MGNPPALWLQVRPMTWTNTPCIAAAHTRRNLYHARALLLTHPLRLPPSLPLVLQLAPRLAAFVPGRFALAAACIAGRRRAGALPAPHSPPGATSERSIRLLPHLLTVVLCIVVHLALLPGALGVLQLLLPPHLLLDGPAVLGSLGSVLGRLLCLLPANVLLLLPAALVLQLGLLVLGLAQRGDLRLGLGLVLVEDDLAVPKPLLHLDDLQLHARPHLMELHSALLGGKVASAHVLRQGDPALRSLITLAL